MFHQFHNLTSYPGIKHFITSRKGGISPPPFDSLNLGFHTSDHRSNVVENRNILAKNLGIHPGSIISCRQVHGDTVEIISAPLPGPSHETEWISCDAMVTAVRGACLLIQVADCVPVLFYDPVNGVVAAAHAGWRGTVRNIAGKTVKVMMEVFGCKAEHILAGIGPSIGPCCYEVGEEVVLEARSAMLGEALSQDGKPVFDLWKANRIQLLNAGLKDSQVETSGICTRCQSGRFYSSRAGKGVTGRFGAGIMLC